MKIAETLILGIGSPFGADRLGWIAIDELRERGLVREGVQLFAADRPGAGLIALMEGREAVVLIDALRAGGGPGSLLRIAPQAIAPGDRFSNHGFGVADAVALGEALGVLPRRLGIIGIVAGDDDSPPPVDWNRCAAMVEEILRENALADG